MVTNVIHFNSTENSWLSNFAHDPFDLEDDTWPTVEHWFQAQKTLHRGTRERIRDAESPQQARKFGRQVKLRKDWLDIRVGVMDQALKARYDMLRPAGFKLVLTWGSFLIHRAPWDSYWGDGKDGQGKNMLGWLLGWQREHIFFGGDIDPPDPEQFSAPPEDIPLLQATYRDLHRLIRQADNAQHVDRPDLFPQHFKERSERAIGQLAPTLHEDEVDDLCSTCAVICG